MIGNDTFCCVCKKPMRSCVIPAVCGSCRIREQVEKKIQDKPVIEDQDKPDIPVVVEKVSQSV